MTSFGPGNASLEVSGSTNLSRASRGSATATAMTSSKRSMFILLIEIFEKKKKNTERFRDKVLTFGTHLVLTYRSGG